MLIKRLKYGLLGIGAAGILFLTCEKMNGPAPIITTPLIKNEIVLISTTAAPLATVQLGSFSKFLIFDPDQNTGTAACVYGFTQADDVTAIPSIFTNMDQLGKIIFQ